VVVEDEMPAGTQLVRVEGVPMEQTSVLGRTVTVNLGQLSAGTETPLALVVAMFDAGHATNTVRVRAVEAVLDAHAEDNQAQGVTVVKPFADLRLVQSALPSPALLDDKVTISVTVSNLSTYRVPDAALVDLLPMSADLLSLTATQGDVFQAPGLAQFDLGSLEPGAVAVVELELRPRAAGALTNEVQITSRYAQPGDANLDSRFVLGVVETPTLGVARSQNKMVISWPRAAEHFVLEYADKPWRPDAWLPERNARVLVDDRVTVTVKTGNDGRYYRLRRPDAPTVSE
jgi:hypothetical protein